MSPERFVKGESERTAKFTTWFLIVKYRRCASRVSDSKLGWIGPWLELNPVVERQLECQEHTRGTP